MLLMRRNRNSVIALRQYACDCPIFDYFPITACLLVGFLFIYSHSLHNTISTYTHTKKFFFRKANNFISSLHKLKDLLLVFCLYS